MIKLNGCDPDSISFPPPIGGPHPTMTITAKDKDGNVIENEGTCNSYPISLLFQLDTKESTYNFDKEDIIVTNGILDLTQYISNKPDATFTPTKPTDGVASVECSVEVKKGSFSTRSNGPNGCEGPTNKDGVKFKWTQTAFPAVEDDY